MAFLLSYQDREEDKRHRGYASPTTTMTASEARVKLIPEAAG
jgi:hypothetical protein